MPPAAMPLESPPRHKRQLILKGPRVTLPALYDTSLLIWFPMESYSRLTTTSHHSKMEENLASA
jgi:hypothetical protein